MMDENEMIVKAELRLMHASVCVRPQRDLSSRNRCESPPNNDRFTAEQVILHSSKSFTVIHLCKK